jgi:photosystem II stability/assembly factor-like uncharacterized protein
MKKILTLLFFLNLNCTFTQAQQWTRIYSDTNRFFSSITFTDSLTGYVSGDSGTILKTTDSGQNWLRLNTGTSAWISSVKFLNPAVGIAVGDTGTVLKTTNGGNTWQPLNAGFRSHDFSQVAFPDASTAFIVGDSAFILKTTDQGASWAPVGDLETKIPATSKFLGMQFLNAQVGFACGGNFAGQRSTILIRTTNGGLNWDTLDHGLPDNRTGLWGVHFPSPDTGYATGVFGVVLKTTNAGNTWIRIRELGGNYSRALHFHTPSLGWLVGSYTGGLSVGDASIKETTNGGADWLIREWPTITSDWPDLSQGRLNGITTVGKNGQFTAFAVGSYGLILKGSPVTGVSSIQGDENRLQVLPNPSEGEFKVVFPKGNKPTKIRILNSLGESVPVNFQPDSAEIQVPSLTAGLYLIQWISGNEIEVRKVVVH